ncbi:phage tail tape measure protein [Bacillus cereus]|uniref:phage tail tape measure protein n=1 Tax=Bacillus cereus TaxID=1396 RepID=UPI000BEBDEB3|nr:phage tail tape measure protein [Bacillus cereus]PDZ54988.1 phage tail tape measure protein [Bacillus cereus]PFI60634.1 phage tail tape measure protein [Bacillus cereus]PGY23281.1 phage tail tape measure protein [Bacillus cereus]
MAGGKIKGITIEIGGNTQPLQNALKDVNKQSDSLTKELKDVERLLKFDPSNVEALAQKQQLLTQQIEKTTQKLDKLKEAEQQVQEQFQNGKISEEQYRAFRREIEFTQGSLDGLKNKLGNMKAEQENVASSTRQLETLFSATGKSVDDFASALGNRLVNAIKSGSATSRQLEQAIGFIGREALGTEADIEKLQRALRSVDAGSSIQQVQNELRDLQQEAGRTEKKFEGLKVGLENVIGGLAAGGGIATAVEKALDMSKLKTKIDISFDVPESSKKSVEEAIRGVTAYGVDAEESLAGVRRQWALNKDISDEANASIVKGAATIAQSYDGIDFTELIQETYEIGNELGITQDSALGMVDALLKMGFPPEQLDIIAEYGSQLTRAGFKAEEVQAIMEAGVETGSWNIDNLLDGLKEGRIQLTEFAQGADKALKEALDGSGIATEQIEKWGASVAKGGRDGAAAMVEVAKAIDGIEDPVKKNQVGVKVLATMFEDQGQNLTNTLIEASKKTKDLQQNQDNLNESVKKLDANPAVKFQKAMGDLQMALEPILGVIADVVASIADWISNNPELAATLAAVATAIGIISGALMAIAPIVVSVMGVFEIGAAAALGIVAIVPIIIAAIVALGVAIYKNWDDIKNWTIEAWDSIKEYLVELWDGISQSCSEAWSSFLEAMHEFFDPIGQFFSDLWEGVKQACSDAWNSTVEFFSEAWSSFVEMMHSFFDPIGEFFSSLWSGIAETASSWWSSLVETASELWGTLTQAWQETWDTILTVLDPIISAVSTVLEAGWLLIQAGAQIAWAAICQYIIQPIQEAYDWVSTQIGEMVTWLGTQWEIAKAMAQIAWGLFKQYIIQPVLDTWNLVKEKFSDLVSWLNSQWETVKSYTSAAWGLFKQYIIKPVQDTWNLVKEKFSDLSNWMLGIWAKIKGYTLEAWKMVYTYIVQPVISAYNSAKEKFNDMYNTAREKFDSVKNAAQEKFEAAKHFIIDPIKDAVDSIEKFIGKIKGFFSDLKLKIPKPEMPPLPHFSLQTSTKNVLGKDITFPSGINIDWRAKGGIFTKPTIFGMNGGNLQGAGEAGREAVLPLNKKTLGDIGAGIVAAMPRQQFAMPREINQLMGDMSRMMASSVSQLSGLKSVMSGVYGSMSNSRQAMASSVSNQVINYGSGSSSSGEVIPMLGGDLVIEVPVNLEGRDVARGTYRYTTEYQEREAKRNSAF